MEYLNTFSFKKILKNLSLQFSKSHRRPCKGQQSSSIEDLLKVIYKADTLKAFSRRKILSKVFYCKSSLWLQRSSPTKDPLKIFSWKKCHKIRLQKSREKIIFLERRDFFIKYLKVYSLPQEIFFYGRSLEIFFPRRPQDVFFDGGPEGIFFKRDLVKFSSAPEKKIFL